MEKLVNDVFILNGAVELLGGLIGLVLPSFYFARNKESGSKSAALWWAFAAISLGIVSLSMSKVSDAEVGKHLASIGFIIYHVGLALAHTGLVDAERPALMKFGGLIAHIALGAVLTKYALDHDAFNTAYTILHSEFFNAKNAIEHFWK